MTPEPDQPLILIVDDDAPLREMMADFLSQEGYRIAEAGHVQAARAAIAAEAPALVLLDLNMPGGDALTLTRELSSEGAVPVIIISGKGGTMDRVVGLEVGADDYLPKPFELRELLARMRAVLRRARRAEPEPEPAPAPQEGRRAQFGAGFVLELEPRRLRNPAGEIVPLTGAEFALLIAFVERPNRVLSRDQIADLTKREEWDAFDRSIDTQVSRLRKKLECAETRQAVIQTVRGEGYVLASTVHWLGKKPASP